MTHLEFFPTPLQEMSFYSKKWGKKVLCKRDDLFSEAGGGSKARMLQYILASDKFRKSDVLLTAGGPNSNFNRACALMCAKLGKPMTLVEYTTEPEDYTTSLNNFICHLAGVKVVNCLKSEVAHTLECMAREFDVSKKTWFQVYGGGKCLEGIYAYYEAVAELRDQFDGNIDEVYIACGTGTTLTGICAGFKKYFPAVTVHAISVARRWEDEKPVLEANMHVLNEFLHKEYDFSNLVFHDDFLLGGYGKIEKEELNTITECICEEGIPVDPVYSGKALYGMSKICPERDSNTVLFWNTGALFNLLSYRDSFDYEEAVLIENTAQNRELLLTFLKASDKQFAIPISSKVDLVQYSERILEGGRVIGVIDNGKLAAAVFFYCNDNVTRSAYITFLCSLPNYRGKGYARKVVSKALSYSKMKGMGSVRTDSVNPSAVGLYRSLGFIETSRILEGDLIKYNLEYKI